jgi:hypothetical protein
VELWKIRAAHTNKTEPDAGYGVLCLILPTNPKVGLTFNCAKQRYLLAISRMKDRGKKGNNDQITTAGNKRINSAVGQYGRYHPIPD